MTQFCPNCCKPLRHDVGSITYGKYLGKSDWYCENADCPVDHVIIYFEREQLDELY